MTDQDKTLLEGNDDMDDVGRLIQRAGPREAVDRARMETARARVAAHWDDVVMEHRIGRRKTRLRLVSVAATLVAAAGLSLFFLQSANVPVVAALATVDRVIGTAAIGATDARRGARVRVDTLITTGGDGRLALAMAGGQSLRLDHGSRLVVHSPNHVSLEQGAIYIDTEFAIDSQPILVETPLGSARDVGTQFQVRLAASVLIVGVRDGLVEVATGDQQNLSVQQGRFLELRSGGGQTERVIGNDDPSWDWVAKIVPAFVIEGATLKAYLHWYANERGVDLRWSDSESERKAGRITLSGSLRGSSLDEGLQIVRQIAPFEYTLDGESMWVDVD